MSTLLENPLLNEKKTDFTGCNFEGATFSGVHSPDPLDVLSWPSDIINTAYGQVNQNSASSSGGLWVSLLKVIGLYPTVVDHENHAHHPHATTLSLIIPKPEEKYAEVKIEYEKIAGQVMPVDNGDEKEK